MKTGSRAIDRGRGHRDSGRATVITSYCPMARRSRSMERRQTTPDREVEFVPGRRREAVPRGLTG